MAYRGIIIEESLTDRSVMDGVLIVSTEVEKTNEGHKTPWISQWTMHTVEIPDDKADKFAERLSSALDAKHVWYADFKNSTRHLIVFREKVFEINRAHPEEYAEARSYGASLGIPEYQLDFSPQVK